MAELGMRYVDNMHVSMLVYVLTTGSDACPLRARRHVNTRVSQRMEVFDLRRAPLQPPTYYQTAPRKLQCLSGKAGA